MTVGVARFEEHQSKFHGRRSWKECMIRQLQVDIQYARRRVVRIVFGVPRRILWKHLRNIRSTLSQTTVCTHGPGYGELT
jgi:hypothetical protein